MAKPEHKHCQYLVSAFVDPYSLKPARSKEVQNFWKLQIKFAKTILEKDPDIKFWVFLKQKAQKGMNFMLQVFKKLKNHELNFSSIEKENYLKF